MKTIIEQSGISVLENGAIRINGEVPTLEILRKELESAIDGITSEGKNIIIFPFNKGHIEYLCDGSFATGESANFTTLSIDEITEYYQLI
jgi:hypothetical protein